MSPPLSGFHPVDLSAQVGAGGCLLDLFRKGGVPRLQFDDAGARIATFQGRSQAQLRHDKAAARAALIGRWGALR